MTNEEVERAIAFILAQQARQDERINQTGAQIAETSRQLAMYAETQTQFMEIATNAIQSLVTAQARTDARINALVGVVERHTGDGHGAQG
jgi:hypothetical protein